MSGPTERRDLLLERGGATGSGSVSAGLLAWNAQLFGEGAGSDDFILTNVMLYWLTGTAASATRFYYEDDKAADPPIEPTTVPTALANFANDIGQRLPLRPRCETGNDHAMTHRALRSRCRTASRVAAENCQATTVVANQTFSGNILKRISSCARAVIPSSGCAMRWGSQ